MAEKIIEPKCAAPVSAQLQSNTYNRSLIGQALIPL